MCRNPWRSFEQKVCLILGLHKGSEFRNQLALGAASQPLLTVWIARLRSRIPCYAMVDIASVRSNWQSRGFSCDIWTDSPGQRWGDYTHSVDEVVMILEGDVEFEINGEVFRPPVGEELRIPAGVLHSVRNRGKTTSRWLYGYKTSR